MGATSRFAAKMEAGLDDCGQTQTSKSALQDRPARHNGRLVVVAAVVLHVLLHACLHVSKFFLLVVGQ